LGGENLNLNSKQLRLKQIVENELLESTHDINHTMRVLRMCITIAKSESNVDYDILKAAALLHDVARVIEDSSEMRSIDHAILGAEMSQKILRDTGYSIEDTIRITHCIETHRFRSDNEPTSIEAKILFDADKLDILGAVGIARSFFYAGQHGETMYSNVNIDEYVKLNLVGGIPTGRIIDISLHAPNIEFQNKCLNIPDRLYTHKGKLIAEERLEYVSKFFDRLRKELGVNDTST